MNRTRPFLLILSLLLITVIPSFARGEETPGPIRIGVYLPMTGPLAPRGQAEYAGIEIAHRMYPSVLGREVELLLVDTAPEDAETADTVTHLIDDTTVCALIGEPVGKNALSGTVAAERSGKPTIIPTFPHFSPAKGKRYLFPIGLTDPLEVKTVARYASERLKTKKAAILMDINRDTSMNRANIFMKHFRGIGERVVAIAYCQTGDTVFATQLSYIITTKPDILYLPLSPPEITLVCGQTAEMGLNVPMITSSNLHVPALIEAGGNALEGVMLPGVFDRAIPAADQNDLTAAYIDRYEKETGGEAGHFDVLGGDAYLLLIDAIRRADSIAGPQIRKALATTTDFRGISGRIAVNEEGDVLRDIILLKVQEEKFQYLETVSPVPEKMQDD